MTSWPCLIRTPVRSFSDLAQECFVPSGPAQTWKGITHHLDSAEESTASNVSFSFEPENSSVSLSSSHHRHSSRSFLSSRLQSSQSSWDMKDHDKLQRSISTAKSSVHMSFRDQHSFSSSSVSRFSIRSRLKSASNQTAIDSYLNKIQQCMRGQSRASRQLAISQSSRLLGKTRRRPSTTAARQISNHRNTLKLDQITGSYRIPRTPSYLSKTRRRRPSELEQFSRPALSQHGRRPQVHTAESSLSMASTTSGISQFDFVEGIVENPNVTNANKRKKRYMARLEPLMVSRVSGEGSSVNGWGSDFDIHKQWNDGGGIILEKTFITKKWQSEQSLEQSLVQRADEERCSTSASYKHQVPTDKDQRVAVKSLLNVHLPQSPGVSQWKPPTKTETNRQEVIEKRKQDVQISTAADSINNSIVGTSSTVFIDIAQEDQESLAVHEEHGAQKELKEQKEQQNLKESTATATSQTWREKIDLEYGGPTLAGVQDQQRRRRSSLHSPTQKEVEGWVNKTKGPILKPPVSRDFKECEEDDTESEHETGLNIKVDLKLSKDEQTMKKDATIEGRNDEPQSKQKRKWIKTEVESTHIINIETIKEDESQIQNQQLQHDLHLHTLISVKSFDSTVRVHRPSQTTESILSALSRMEKEAMEHNDTNNDINSDTNSDGDGNKKLTTIVENNSLPHQQVLCHQLLVMMRDACESSTSNDFLNVFSACDETGTGTLTVQEMCIGLQRLGFRAHENMVAGTLSILNMLPANESLNSVVIRYLIFIERVKQYLSPTERSLEKTQYEVKKSFDTIDEAMSLSKEDGSNENDENHNDISYTTGRKTDEASVSGRSTVSSSLRTSLMRPRKSMSVILHGNPITEARERQQMQDEEWQQERAKWGFSTNPGAWQIVRVFVSSTFNDFHGERDTLQREVFPELNELLRSRRVRVVPVDLRWGLTKEDTSSTGLGAIEYCLREVDESRPFFLLMEGERYGWSPPTYRISDRPEFDWVKSYPLGHAITEMEALHGFLRKPYTPGKKMVFHLFYFTLLLKYN